MTHRSAPRDRLASDGFSEPPDLPVVPDTMTSAHEDLDDDLAFDAADLEDDAVAGDDYAQAPADNGDDAETSENQLFENQNRDGGEAPARRKDRESLPSAIFNKLLIDSLPHMRAFARSLTDDRALADDLAQEAATRALANRDSYHAGTNFRAWIFTIVRNCFYSEHRRKWRRMEKGNEDAMIRAGAPETQESGLRMEDFKRGFTLLSEEQREALVLVGACGFDYQQAAEIAGCAVGTMKSRVSRARAELRTMLDEDALKGDRSEFAKLAKGGFEDQLDRSLGLK
ncbi:RNA polymerase subunit sigma-70 [Rhodospirillum rubrum]|uniref:sigma-70 family RNA polymerase sigma factor n=1 Tax=Rhodospirillum rubrum TaxID=1085 RepID=UPI001907D95C|nr:sigma-70 family RNA polymerase sigma factor [Rhodospirillum rubrum]MBK1666203.1 RNA polymerase subunit sigma-70 [Rhodospirillum rubrum]MBK1678192.1 RNA polymerase subunit sigma-70 [Rhodospirillum rubrum]